MARIDERGPGVPRARATARASRHDRGDDPLITGSYDRRLTKENPRLLQCGLRHTFAVNTLLGWYRQGVDVQARLPSLSTYLGHRNPSYTYHYLSAAPELLAHAAGLLDAARGVAR